MSEEIKTWEDSENLLKILFEKHGRYFTHEKYTTPSSRYEAWLMANTLSNLMVAKALKELASEIFQKLDRSSIISETGSPEIVLKRRGGK